MSHSPGHRTLTGSCLCGKIFVLLRVPKDFLESPQGHLCHCSNCRKFAGSFTGLNCLMIGTSQLRLSDPNSVMRTYDDTDTLSGGTVPRSFCGNCGCPVGSIAPKGLPAMSMVSGGLFGRALKPKFECFVKNRPHFVPRVASEENKYWQIDELGQEIGQIMKAEAEKSNGQETSVLEGIAPE